MHRYNYCLEVVSKVTDTASFSFAGIRGKTRRKRIIDLKTNTYHYNRYSAIS